MSQAPSEPTGARFGILLVENDAFTLMCFEELLRDAGYRVLIAPDKAAALDVARRHRPPLLLTDLNLPDGNGADLLTEIRADYPVRGIALTGYDLSRAEFEAAGFVAGLIKPIDFDVLLATVARVAASP